MQLLNNTSPSLLQKISKAEGVELSRACSTGFERLKNAGLDYVDSAIVMKAFLDEAKGDSSWLENSVTVKGCFSQAPAIQSYLERIYGRSVVEKEGGQLQQIQ